MPEFGDLLEWDLADAIGLRAERQVQRQLEEHFASSPG
jgi:hypothetical protein